MRAESSVCAAKDLVDPDLHSCPDFAQLATERGALAIAAAGSVAAGTVQQDCGRVGVGGVLSTGPGLCTTGVSPTKAFRARVLRSGGKSKSCAESGVDGSTV